MPQPLRRLALAAALAATLGAAACGEEEPGVDEPAREGLALPLAGIHYNVFLTRQLNPAIAPDQAYYKGPPPPPDRTLYGVFIQACNLSEESHQSISQFRIRDNQGNEFEPKELPEDNPFVYNSRTLSPQECIPSPGSVAQQGPVAGAMLLFELPLQAAENRPLELELIGPFEPLKAKREMLTVELDL